MSHSYDFDLLVIGAGSGGVRCARVAASLGAKVAIVEGRYLGGTCVNVGCVPKKLFVYASQFSSLAEEASGFGWSFLQENFSWQTLKENKDQEIARLNSVYQGLLENTEVKIISGLARFVGSHQVIVDDVEYSAKSIVVATGGWPKKGGYPGAEYAITSNDVFAMSQLPKTVLVEGGGYIAVEFAGIFNGLGCDTSLVYRGPLFLRGFDSDVRNFLAEQVREKGINLDFNTEIASISKTPKGQFEVMFRDGRSTVVDLVFSAIGREAMLENLGLEKTQVKLNQYGYIHVDDHFRTDDSAIYALGDVIGRVPLTPVALKEGMALAHHLCSGTAIEMDYTNIPTAVFSQPEMASVGLTEEQAKGAYSEVEVFQSNFRPLKHTLSGSAERTFMKLVVEKESQRVLGCHMVGEHAAEIMQGLAIAVAMGATKAQFDKTVGIHPTAAEEFVTMR